MSRLHYFPWWKRMIRISTKSKILLKEGRVWCIDSFCRSFLRKVSFPHELRTILWKKTPLKTNSFPIRISSQYQANFVSISKDSSSTPTYQRSLLKFDPGAADPASLPLQPETIDLYFQRRVFRCNVISEVSMWLHISTYIAGRTVHRLHYQVRY